jgi:hypothetical protein
MSFLLFFQTESPEASGCGTRRRRAAEQRDELAPFHWQ